MKVYVNQQFSYKQHALNSDANYLMITKEVYLVKHLGWSFFAKIDNR